MTVHQIEATVTGDHPLAGAALLIRWADDKLRGRPVLSAHVAIEGRMVPVQIADLVRQHTIPFDQPKLPFGTVYDKTVLVLMALTVLICLGSVATWARHDDPAPVKPTTYIDWHAKPAVQP